MSASTRLTCARRCLSVKDMPVERAAARRVTAYRGCFGQRESLRRNTEAKRNEKSLRLRAFRRAAGQGLEGRPRHASPSEPTFRSLSAWNAPCEVASAAAAWVARRARASSIGAGFARYSLVMGGLSPLDLRALVEVIQPIEGADRVGVFGCPGCLRRRIGRTARRPGYLTRKRARRQGARKRHRTDGAHKCSPHIFLPFIRRLPKKQP